MHKLTKITALFLLLVMGFFLAGSTLFIHSHTINGERIIHSHPFCGTASSHTHSSSSIYTLNRILNPDMVCGESIATNNITSVIESVVVVIYTNANYQTENHIHQLRAPPAKA